MENIINVRNSKSINTNGTSLISSSYLKASYDDLVKVFGEPTYYEPSDDGKVTTEWKLEFETTDNEKPYIVATIYDWKTYDFSICREGVYNWHVGGHSYDAYDAIKAYLEKELVNA
tara:strand:+ start:10822 stop:11169 length:348 start_codon:yes stop_codon:yes gene_type:complete